MAKDCAKGETIAVRSTGEFGRLTIPAELRKKFGTCFLVIETATGIVLEPIEDTTQD